jgi:hypothetical protein
MWATGSYDDPEGGILMQRVQLKDGNTYKTVLTN